MEAQSFVLEFIFVIEVDDIPLVVQATGTAYFDDLENCWDAAGALLLATQDQITRFCELRTAR